MYAGGWNGVRRIKWCVRILRHGRRADNCTGNRTRTLTTGGGKYDKAIRSPAQTQFTHMDRIPSLVPQFFGGGSGQSLIQ